MKEIRRQHKLENAIQEKGLKKKAIAFFLGIHPQSLSEIISGSKQVTEENKVKLSQILERPLEELFE